MMMMMRGVFERERRRQEWGDRVGEGRVWMEWEEGEGWFDREDVRRGEEWKNRFEEQVVREVEEEERRKVVEEERRRREGKERAEREREAMYRRAEEVEERVGMNRRVL